MFLSLLLEQGRLAAEAEDAKAEEMANPMVNCSQDFTRCTQDQGEKFNVCWEKKLAKAVE